MPALTEKPGDVTTMTETLPDTDDTTTAVGLIDEALANMMHRELVSSDEVSDLLLDLRSLIAPSVTDEIETAFGAEGALAT